MGPSSGGSHEFIGAYVEIYIYTVVFPPLTDVHASANVSRACLSARLITG